MKYEDDDAYLDEGEPSDLASDIDLRIEETKHKEIFESREPQAHGGELKRKKDITAHIYGEDFDGHYMRVAELAPLLGNFKDFYFQKKRESQDNSATRILVDFNKKIKPEKFWPNSKQLRKWRDKWDRIFAIEQGYQERQIAESRRINEVVKVRDAERAITLVPDEDELESGMKTLGGMLVNDAVDMLQNDKEMEDLYTSDELVKRKSYALNVFAHVTRNVQGKEGLRIKRQGEARETAGFLMNLLQRAKAGKIAETEMTVLKGSFTPVQATE